AVLALGAAVFAITQLTGGQSASSPRTAATAPTVLAAPPQPSPTATCDSASCSGLDPAGTPCRYDAKTTAYKQAYGILIELRFSPSCRAAWAKMTGSSADDRIQVFGKEGTPPDQQEYRQQHGHDAHTKMVHSVRPTDANACAIVVARGTACTDDAAMTPTAAPQ
ncbi:DUF2690 domain-containing protein, partial [Streptomyces sp. FH025]|uniref:DUF2690 domain-containing protein n=1 Tax=Streptomyces sp. FH025 TaxID=2815937 RepID=UPI001A9D0EBE